MNQAFAQTLQEALAAELRAAQAIAQINVKTWAERASITDDSIYRVLRGRRPVSVVELVMLCEAIDDDPRDLISRATRRAGEAVRGSRAAEIGRADRARLAVEAAGLHSDLDAAYLTARAALSEEGHLLSQRDWYAFLEGIGSTETVSALSSFLEVPNDYLAGTEDAASSRVELQLKFARTMREVGVVRLAARSLDELQPEEIHAVETAIREFIDEEEGP
jgi:transcriptional regulator with XRE-family HTH domain